MTNIFAAVPAISPSVLYSSAGAATALAKPVIGTSVPAPPSLASLSYWPSPVSRIQKKLAQTADRPARQKSVQGVLFDV